jgi:translocation and assembly module TamB
VEGLAGKAPATLVAELQTEALTIPRAGQDLATIDVDAKLTGKVSASALEAELRIPSGTVRLPNRIPRRIQPLDQRPDIVVGKPPKRSTLAGAGKAPTEPYHVRVQVLAPGRFFIKSDNPRMNVELRADVTADYQDRLALEGDVETVRGQVEPIGGRIFDVKRGRVRFTGEPMAGMLEVQAQYNNPAAKVYVAVAGTIEKPDVKLTSEPAMEESQIALLIATGRAELKAGSGGVSSLASEETGKAALGAVATTVFRDVLSDKLPVDTVALDSSQLRAGKYVTDKIYVGYTRRFNANPEQGENTNEVRVEYQISPRWTFQSRYGDAQSGGASVLWSKDY